MAGRNSRAESIASTQNSGHRPDGSQSEARVETIAELWQALPTPQKIEAYEKAYPGTTERMLRLAETRIQDSWRVARAQILMNAFGHVCAFASVIVLAFVAKYFVDAHAPAEGAAIVVTGAVSIVGIFVTGRVVKARQGQQSEDFSDK